MCTRGARRRSFAVHAQEDRKSEYVRAVVRGAGLMPWQEAGVSEAEQDSAR